jgi:hypothetical protein
MQKGKVNMKETFSEKDVITVESVGEEYEYISKVECPSCHGAGTLERATQALIVQKGKHYDRLDCRCFACGTRATFTFDINSFFATGKELEDFLKNIPEEQLDKFLKEFSEKDFDE